MSESYVTNNPTNFKSDNNDYLRVRSFARVNCFARVPACLHAIARVSLRGLAVRVFPCLCEPFTLISFISGWKHPDCFLHAQT